MPDTRIQLLCTRTRTGERGAALFVVVMVITLLTAVGLFAARSTSLVDAATGYARQAAQTVALADYGAHLVASELGQGRAERVFQLMDLGNQYCPTYGDQATATTPQPCYAYDYSQLELRVQQNTSDAFNVIEWQASDHDGSLGPEFTLASANQGVDGVLVVELFDPFQISNIQGESASKPAGREVTINSIAQIRPFTTANDDRSQNASLWCSPVNAGSATAATVLSVRSQVIVPSL
jgi:hypothetical protein